MTADLRHLYRLRRIAAAHPPARVVLFYSDGTMQVETAGLDRERRPITLTETIPATVPALKAWLGY